MNAIGGLAAAVGVFAGVVMLIACGIGIAAGVLDLYGVEDAFMALAGVAMGVALVCLGVFLMALMWHVLST